VTINEFVDLLLKLEHAPLLLWCVLLILGMRYILSPCRKFLNRCEELAATSIAIGQKKTEAMVRLCNSVDTLAKNKDEIYPHP
jgi:hypothetical protein